MNNYSYNGSENYCYHNTNVLINKLNIRNDKELSIAERDITTFRLAKLFESPVPKYVLLQILVA